MKYLKKFTENKEYIDTIGYAIFLNNDNVSSILSRLDSKEVKYNLFFIYDDPDWIEKSEAWFLVLIDIDNIKRLESYMVKLSKNEFYLSLNNEMLSLNTISQKELDNYSLREINSDDIESIITSKKYNL